jgi:hypothetical protein
MVKCLPFFLWKTRIRIGRKEQGPGTIIFYSTEHGSVYRASAYPAAEGSCSALPARFFTAESDDIGPGNKAGQGSRSGARSRSRRCSALVARKSGRSPHRQASVLAPIDTSSDQPQKGKLQWMTAVVGAVAPMGVFNELLGRRSQRIIPARLSPGRLTWRTLGSSTAACAVTKGEPEHIWPRCSHMYYNPIREGSSALSVNAPPYLRHTNKEHGATRTALAASSRKAASDELPDISARHGSPWWDG